ncbi:hypothetical protein [Leuconostoc citreum]|uniref:hypothetical protein n=1 Tax=Leuconostoc citreum TaxID=33964 RepID=UPI0032DE5202
MVKATINNFESLALSGKSLGKIEYASRRSVGKRSDTDVALVNLNGDFDTVNIQPQAGFNFGMADGTPLKLVNARLLATEARQNGRSAIVQGIQGSLLPLSDTATDDYDEAEYDMLFVTGKDNKPVGRVRSKDAFDSYELKMIRFEPILKRDYRGQLDRDQDTGETTITSYSIDFIQDKTKDDELGHNIRIILSKTEFERLRPQFKLRHKYVPQGLKLAFVGNEITNWTIYADTLVPVEAELKEPTKSASATKSTSTSTNNNEAKGTKN